MAPSAIRYRPDSQVPREMDRARIWTWYVTSSSLPPRFGEVEVPASICSSCTMAHGYLMASFLTPLVNQSDRPIRGCASTNQDAVSLEVFEAVRGGVARRAAVIGADLGDRLGRGRDRPATMPSTFARVLAGPGADLIDVSTGQTTVEADPSTEGCIRRRIQRSDPQRSGDRRR